MESSLRNPRRIVVALILTLIGGSVAVAASGLLAISPVVPESFTPAQPLPGDQAEWAYVIVDGEGPSERARPELRYEVLPLQWTWDIQGEPTLAKMAAIDEANYWRHDADDATGPASWTWSGPLLAADDEAGNVLWHERQDDGASWEAGNAIQGSFSFESGSLSRVYRESNGVLVIDCLARPLPADFPAKANIEACTVAAPRYHPDQDYTGADIHALAESTVGLMIIGSHWEAIGSGQTPYGDAIVVSAKADERDLGVTAWFVESVPYPVQLVYEREDATWVHQMTSFTRGAPVSATPPPIAKFPAPHMTQPQPWGPADAGHALDFPPSDAYAAAVADDALGLQAWMDDHDGAYMEYAAGGNDGDLDQWKFQMRSGPDRFAFQVRMDESGPASLIPGGLAPPSYRTDRLDSWNIRNSPGVAPETIPDLASAAKRLRAIAGVEATWFEYTWGCREVVQVGTCEDLIGPVVQARGSMQSGGDEPLALVSGSQSEAWTYELRSYPGGDLDSLFGQWSRDEQAPFYAPAGPAQESSDVVTVEGGWAVPSLAAVAGATLLAALAGLLYWLWPALKSGGVGLFSRIQRDRVLDHPKRQRLYDAIEAEPGVHHQQLVRVVGAKGTARHHLDKLVEAGVVLRHDAGGYRCYFPRRTDRRAIAAAPALRAATARKVYAFIQDNPGSSGGAVATALEINRGTVSHHAKRLAAAGVIRTETTAQGTRFWSA